MKIGEWEQEVSRAFTSEGKSYTAEMRKIMKSEVDNNSQDGRIAAEVMLIMQRWFWRKVVERQTFGSVNRVAEKFGRSLEENYGMPSGPFMDLARTYWTYRIEMRDLFPDHHNKWLSQALLTVERDTAALFFPTPGPITFPVNQRREAQRECLEKFAPTFDIDTFLAQSPVLRAGKNRGCLGLVAVIAIIAFTSVVGFSWKYWA